ncbi:hypothetical protein ACP70R_034200 [Stipagrostis hirtigluma subsp. patula]
MAVGALLEFAAVAAGCVEIYRRRADLPRLMPRGRVDSRALLFAALLAAHFALLLSVAYSSVAANRAVVAYVEESTELIRLERMQIQGEYSVGQTIGAEERANKVNFEPPKVDVKDEQEAAPPPSEAQARTPETWRAFDFPSDHALLLGCSGDEFTVRIMPRLEGLEQQKLRLADGDLPDGCLRTAAGTPSMYNHHPYYQALFWSLPGQEQRVPMPVMFPESTVAPVVEEAPEAFVLSADVVAFYRPMPGRSEMHIMARDAVGFMPMSEVQEAGQALQALNPHTILLTKQ